MGDEKAQEGSALMKILERRGLPVLMRIRYENGDLLWMCGRADFILFVKIRNGRVVKPPHGYKVRKDKGGHDPQNPKPHFHFIPKKGSDTEYVVSTDGTGSHDTEPGTILPRSVGEWLFEEAGVPLDTSHGDYQVTLTVLPNYRGLGAKSKTEWVTIMQDIVNSSADEVRLTWTDDDLRVERSDGNYYPR